MLKMLPANVVSCCAVAGGTVEAVDEGEDATEGGVGCVEGVGDGGGDGG